jgi:hypothetical protein
VVAVVALVAGRLLQHPFGGAAVFAVLTVTALDTAWRLTSSWLADSAPSLRLAGALLLFEAIAAGCVAIPGSFGAFSLPVVAAVVGALHAITVRRGRPPRSLRDLLAELRFGSGANPLADVCLLAVFVVFLFVLMLQVRFLVQDADSMWYHLVMAGEWVRTGSIAPIDAIPLIGVGYPGFRQALIAFLSLPFGNEHLALLVVLEFPLLVLAVYALARTYGCGRALALAGALYAATTPVVMGALSTQGNDLSLAIHLLLAVLFLGRFFASGDKRQAVFAGLALGALASIKFSGPGYAMIALLVACVQYGWRWLRRGKGVLLLAGSALLLSVPWYLRNLLAFGNPLYPARVQLGEHVLFDGPLGKDYFVRDTLGWNVQPLLDNWHHFFDAHGWLVPLVALGPLLVVVAVRRLPRRPLLGLALLPVLLFVAFLHHPFNRPWVEAGAGYTHRYLVVWFTASMVAALVGLAQLPGRVVWVLLFLAAAFAGLTAITHWVPILVGAIVSASLLSLWMDVPSLLDRWLARLPRVRLRAGLLLLACTGVTWSLAGYRERQQYAAEFGYHDAASERGWGPVVAWVHQHVHDQRVGLHGSLYMFPLLGEPWSNEVFLADDLHLPEVPQKTVAEVATWARERRLDYLVCCVRRLERTGSHDYTFGTSIADELRTLWPAEFEQVFASRGAAVLQVRHGDGR